MIKAFIQLTLFIAFNICFSACKKETIIPKKDFGGISNLADDIGNKYQHQKDGNIVMMNEGRAWVKDDDAYIYISAYFFKNKNPNDRVFRNGLAIDTVDILSNRDNQYPGYFLATGNNPDRANWLEDLWGKKIKLSLGGSVMQTTGTNDNGFYVPHQIVMNAPFVDSFKISIHSYNTLHWLPDVNNPGKKVYLEVLYEGDFSQQFNSNVPSGTSVKQFLEIPDNGSYTLLPDQLQSLTPGARTTITLARYNYELMADPLTQTKTLVYAFTFSSSGPIFINQ